MGTLRNSAAIVIDVDRTVIDALVAVLPVIADVQCQAVRDQSLVRELEYLHWWTFISAYYEIGDCFFAQIVRIRNLKAKGKPLDKTDQQLYRENRELVDLKTNFTAAEDAVINAWLGKK